MNVARQTFHLLAVTLRGIQHRLAPTLVVVIGVACAVGVLISMLSIGAGIKAMAMKNVRADRVILESTGGSMMAPVSREDVQIVTSLPWIAKDADGKAKVSTDVRVAVRATRKNDVSTTSVTIAGVGPQFQSVYPEVRLAEGRLFRTGTYEVVVGRNARSSFHDLEPGDFVTYQGVRWDIVGAFEADGGLVETWLLADADTVRSAFNRSGYNYLTAILGSPRDVEAMSTALRDNPSVTLELRTDAEVRARQSRALSGMVNFLSYFVASIMAVGAMVGALNSIYSTVEARRRDFATLRALGFAPVAIAVAVLAEALILASAGSAIGVSVPWLVFSGNPIELAGLNFSLVVTPELAALGVCWALAMGAAGGLFPALSASLGPITSGLRAT